MEEQEEQQEPREYKSSWSDTNLAKGVGWAFAIVGVLATVVGVAFSIYLFLREPTASLSAVYQESQFVLPNKVGGMAYIDSVLAERDVRLRRLSRALKSHLTPREAFLLPDSLQLYGLHRAYYGLGPVKEFAGNHHYFYVLTIKNEGEKTLDRLHLIHDAEAWYEFKDSSGALQQGQSASNLPLGNLAPTESREVYLWTLSRLFTLSKGLTITYDEGKVQAKPVTVNGTAIVEAYESKFQWTELISYASLGAAAFFLFQLFRGVFTRRS
jgi:hypothetical protein